LLGPAFPTLRLLATSLSFVGALKSFSSFIVLGAVPRNLVKTPSIISLATEAPTIC